MSLRKTRPEKQIKVPRSHEEEEASERLLSWSVSGLLMPRVGVERHGIKRTDVGNLGGGIYFSDAFWSVDGEERSPR